MKNISLTYPSLKLLYLPEVSPRGTARNFLLNDFLNKDNNHASVEETWIHFLDDDIKIPAHYFNNLSELMAKHPQAIAFSGPDLGLHNNCGFEFRASLVMASPLGTGPSHTRYSLAKERIGSETHITSASLVVRKDFITHDAFPNGWQAGEESIFLANLSKLGLIIYSPQLAVEHPRRKNIIAFARQFFRYGTGRGRCIRTKFIFNWLHLIPFLFLGTLLIFPIFTLGLYLSLVIIQCLVIAGAFHIPDKSNRIGLKQALLCSYLFPVLHISYFIGLLWGLANFYVH